MVQELPINTKWQQIKSLLVQGGHLYQAKLTLIHPSNRGGAMVSWHDCHDSQVLGVLEVVGNGEHDLRLIATAGHHMVTVQSLLDEEWKAWKLLLHNCLDDVPVPPLMAHLVENCLLCSKHPWTAGLGAWTSGPHG